MRGIDTSDVSSHFFESGKFIDYIMYQTDLKNIKKLVKKILGISPDKIINPTYDFIAQSDKTFKNESSDASQHKKIEEIVIGDNIEIIAVFDEFCSDQNINCIFIHSPIHVEPYNKIDPQYIENVSSIFQDKDLVYIPKIFGVENKYMGDSTKHVDVSYKSEITRMYFEQLEQYLE